MSPLAPGTLSYACWPFWVHCCAFRVWGGLLVHAQRGCGCRVHTASVRAPQLQAKGPEDAPALSLFSLLFPLPFSMSQMAILLKTSKKALHSTAHMCPGMFVDLSESQPCPRLRSCPLKSIQKCLCSALRAESIFKSSKHTTTHSQALSFPRPQGTGCLVREAGCEVTVWRTELLVQCPALP